MRELSTIALIGAGPLGRRLAELCWQAGYRTILEDLFPANLREAKERLGEPLATAQGNGALAGGVEFASSVEDAVREADLILDCVPDELESKLEIFSLLDRMAPPRSILLTPTKTQSIADLASCTYRPERCVALELPPEFLGGSDALPSPVTMVHTSSTLPEVLEAVNRFGKKIGLDLSARLDPREFAPGEIG